MAKLTKHQRIATYGPPMHRLEQVRMTLDLATPRWPDVTACKITGWSNTKRAPLWSEGETWSPTEVHPSGLEIGDWVHHVILCATQDRPASQEELLYSLTGGMGEQRTLF